MYSAAVTLVVEDRLSEAVMLRLVHDIWSDWKGNAAVHVNHGIARIKANIKKWNEAARIVPVIILVDSDDSACSVEMKADWLPNGESRKLIFRIAVREVESWLLADHVEFPKFLGISTSLLPRNPDTVVDPKNELIQLAKRSPRRSIREGIVPRDGSGATIGPTYNDVLAEFAETKWFVPAARNFHQVSIAHADL